MQPLNRLDVFYFLVRISVGPPGFWFSHRSVSGIVAPWVSLSACNHMCVHTCVSCVCVCVCVCVCFLFCLSGSRTPLCVSVFACRFIHTLDTGQKQLGETQRPLLLILNKHLLTYRNTVLCPNTQDQLTFMLPSNHFRDFFESQLSELQIVISRVSLWVFTVLI